MRRRARSGLALALWALSLVLASLAVIPVGAAIAVLRYRLYEIDLVIDTAIVLGGLLGFITAVYLAVVIGIGTAVGRSTGSNIVLAVVATALVAAAFQPVGARLQRLARRLVYGKPSDAEEQAGVAVRCLGAFRVTRAGEPVPVAAWQSKKARTLLKVLLARRGRSTTRDHLEILWPGEPSRSRSIASRWPWPRRGRCWIPTSVIRPATSSWRTRTRCGWTWRACVADAWTAAGPAAKPAHLAVFAAASQITDAFFFCAFVALGLYLGTLSAAILSGSVYARWIGWLCAASASLVLAGDFLTLASDAAFFAVLLGFLLFMAALIALGVTMWRQAAPSTSATGRMVTVTGDDLG